MNPPLHLTLITTALLACVGVLAGAAELATVAPDARWITYEAKPGAGQGKHVVLLSGDEEYRSEEGLPLLGKILSQRHGFKCTVLFPLDPDGTINPDNQKSLPGAEALDSADVIIMALRFRNWPDADMKHFVDAMHRGVPVIGLRTSTHAFNFPANTGSAYQSYTYNNDGGFGKKVFGETWLNHWGRHKIEATRGVIAGTAKSDPLLNGVVDLFGDTDVYEAYPVADAKILIWGQVLKGMKPTDAPADYRKRRGAGDRQEQGINEPMMPVVWSRLHQNEGGTVNRVLATTMGSATDLKNEAMRRLVVNGVYWGLNLKVPSKADVTVVDEYNPTMYGFKGYRKGIKPSDHALGKVLPAGVATP